MAAQPARAALVQLGTGWMGGGQLLGEAWKGVRGRCMDPPLLLLPHSLQLLNHPIRLTASILKD